MHPPQSRLLLVSALLALVLMPRLIVTYQGPLNPFYAHPILDPGRHHASAQAVAAGEGLPDEAFDTAPLYPWALGQVYRLFGDGPLAPRVIQHAIGALTVIGVGLLAGLAFGRGPGWVAAFLASLYWPYPYFEEELLGATAALFLVTWGLTLFLAAWDRRGRVGALALAGSALLLGLSVLARPNGILLGAVAVPTAFLAGRGRRFWSRLGRAALFVAIFLSPAGLVSLRNSERAGSPVFVATSGGVNLYLGNHPGADGWSAGAPGLRREWPGAGEDARRIAEAAEGRPLDAAGVSRYWTRRVVEWGRSAPGALARLLVKKTLIFLQGYEYSNNQHIYHYRGLIPALRGPWLGFGAVLPVALAGAVATLRGNPRAAFLAASFAAYAASVIMFFVCGRFRLPITPVVLAFAAAALAQAARWWRGRRARRLLLFALAAGGLAVAANTNWAGLTRPSQAQPYVKVALLYQSRNQFDEAVAAYREAERWDDRYPDLHKNLGAALLASGRTAEAMLEFKRELDLDPGDGEALANLAFALQSSGRVWEAVPVYRRALDARPDDTQLWYNLGVCYDALSDWAEAERTYRELLARDPGHIPGRNNLGASLARQGRYEEAEEAWREVLRRAPGFERARENLNHLRERFDPTLGD
jgi:tetratricopeptide (TPR) repeat protein